VLVLNCVVVFLAESASLSAALAILFSFGRLSTHCNLLYWQPLLWSVRPEPSHGPRTAYVVTSAHSAISERKLLQAFLVLCTDPPSLGFYTGVVRVLHDFTCRWLIPHRTQFFSIYTVNSIAGNLLSGVLLRSGVDIAVLFVVFGLIGAVGVACLLFLRCVLEVCCVSAPCCSSGVGISNQAAGESAGGASAAA
jgi:hypothetical protein